MLNGTRIKSALRIGFNGNTATKIPLMYSFSGNCAASAPYFHIHVTVSDLYIPRIGPHIFGCSKIDRPILEIYKSLTDMSRELGDRRIQFCFGNKEAAQFYFLGTHNGEPGIYIEFTPAIHLQ